MARNRPGSWPFTAACGRQIILNIIPHQVIVNGQVNFRRDETFRRIWSWLRNPYCFLIRQGHLSNRAPEKAEATPAQRGVAELCARRPHMMLYRTLILRGTSYEQITILQPFPV